MLQSNRAASAGTCHIKKQHQVSWGLVIKQLMVTKAATQAIRGSKTPRALCIGSQLTMLSSSQQLQHHTRQPVQSGTWSPGESPSQQQQMQAIQYFSHRPRTMDHPDRIWAKLTL